MQTRNEPGLRLQVYLARAGLGSRRRCELFITEGRVRVDGRVVRELGSRVGEGATVELDGRRLTPETRYYLAVNKPVGYVCSNRKMDDRPLVSDLFRTEIPGRLFHVGRLDVLSTGLIVYTNDGEFANRVSHPSHEVEKEYLVDTVDPVPERVVESWKRGVTVEGVRYVVSSATRHSPTRLSLVLVEGRNREIRRILDAFGLRIRSVHRVRIGAVSLRGLRPGAFRKLTPAEIRSLSGTGKAHRPAKPPRAVHKKSQHGRSGP